MDVREKLVELLNDSFDEQYSKRGLLTAPHTATDLIAHGVTVQEWIPVTERLPERTFPPHDVLVYHNLGNGMLVDRAWFSNEQNRWHSVLWMKLKVTHWMPLPEPPKEDEHGEKEK